MIHEEQSPLAGQTVQIKKHVKHFQFENFGGSDFVVEDWWDRVSGKSWKDCTGNPGCLVYAMRVGMTNSDDEVLYGKVGLFGHLVHISEIDLPE